MKARIFPRIVPIIAVGSLCVSVGLSSHTDAKPKLAAQTVAAHAVPTPHEKRFAIIIGIDKYTAGICTLHSAVSDARKIDSALLEPTVGGFAPENVTMLLTANDDPAMQPTRANIIKALDKTAAKAGPNDTIWFYFAGHGTDHEGFSYILPCDCQVGQWETTAISTHLLRDKISAGVQKANRVIILDSCHSGSSRSPVPVMTVQFPPGTITIAACDKDQSAYEMRPDGGIFTEYFVRGLSGAADTNHDHVVTVDEMNAYVVPNVSSLVEKNEGDLQTPKFLGNDEFVLATPRGTVNVDDAPPTISPVAQRPLAPPLMIALTETRMLPDGNSVPSELFGAEIEHGLINANVPIVERSMSSAVNGIDNPVDATAKASKLGARFLLKGNAEISIDTIHGDKEILYIATASLTVKLFDSDGSVIAANTYETPPHHALHAATAGAAANRAVQDVASQMLADMVPKLQQVIKPTK